MLLSTLTAPIASVLNGPAGAVHLLANAGFDAYDFSMFDSSESNPVFGDNWKVHLQTVKDTAAERGIVCNQAHAPFPSLDVDTPKNAEYNRTIYDKLVRAIQSAGYLGAKVIVVHPIQHLPFRDNEAYLKDMNMDFYRSLAPVAKAAGVKIALENMWQRDKKRHYIIDSTCASPQSFCDYLDTLGDDCFTACLDLGHCALCGYEAAELIRGLGHARLGALHVHDNDCLKDQHTVPYCGRTDWDSVCDALSEINYTGDFTFEAGAFLSGIPTDFLPEAASYLCHLGRYLINKIKRNLK